VFRRCVRAEISKIVTSPTEVDDEIKYLMTAWAGYLKGKQVRHDCTIIDVRLLPHAGGGQEWVGSGSIVRMLRRTNA